MSRFTNNFERLLHYNFVNIVRHTPDKIAVRTSKESITYQELFLQADKISQFILSKGKSKELVIAVAIDKSVTQIAAIVGILLSGYAYMPINPSWPKARIEQILRKSKVKTIVTHSEFAKKFSSFADCKIFYANDIVCCRADNNRLLSHEIKSCDVAYVLFTSGSTGDPKGVAIEHGSVFNTIVHVNSRFDVNAQDAVLALAAANFDLSVYDIFGMLNVGGTIVLPTTEEMIEPARWIEYLNAYDVTIWNSVPALSQMLVEYIANYYDQSLVFPKVRVVHMGGDWIPLDLPNKLKKIFPNARIVGGGGSTETSIWGCMYEIKDVDPQWKNIPYGKALPGQTMRILDKYLNECPEGVIGEICFGGVGLARGYWNDPERTKQSFQRHPTTGEVIYRSGDLGRLMDDGNVEILGRIDNQIQVNGYRVELEEVELFLSRHPCVAECMVLAKDTKNKSKRLIGAVVLRNNILVKDRQQLMLDIKNFLAVSLPEYMVPKSIIFVDHFPLSGNGKVDRLALTAMIDDDLSTKVVAPANQIEEQILKVWQEVFENCVIGVECDFFELGGTSFLAATAVAKINNKFNTKIPLSALINNFTVRKLAAYVNAAMSLDKKAHSKCLITLNECFNQNIPIFLIHPIGGTVFCYKKLALMLNRAVYGIAFEYTEEEFAEKSIGCLKDLARQYAQLIIDNNDGPYFIAGWSSGGTISYEVAKQLSTYGKEVLLVCLLDTTNPNVYRSFDDNKKINLFAVQYYLNEINKHLQQPIPVPENLDYNLHILKLIDEVTDYNYIEAKLKDHTALAEVKRFAFSFKTMLDLVLKHSISDTVERMLFFRAEQSKPEIGEKWRAFSQKNLTIINVPGDHLRIVESPIIEIVAEQLEKQLQRIEADLENKK